MLFKYFILISIYRLILIMLYSIQKERIVTKEERRRNWRWSWSLLNTKVHTPLCVLYSGKSIVVLLINTLLSTISHHSHIPSLSLEATATCRNDGSSTENSCYCPIYSLWQRKTKAVTGGGRWVFIFISMIFYNFFRDLFLFCPLNVGWDGNEVNCSANWVLEQSVIISV